MYRCGNNNRKEKQGAIKRRNCWRHIALLALLCTAQLGSTWLGLAFCLCPPPAAALIHVPLPFSYLPFPPSLPCLLLPQVVRIYLRHFTHLFVLTFLQYRSDCFTVSAPFPSTPCHALTPVQFEYFLYFPPHSLFRSTTFL